MADDILDDAIPVPSPCINICRLDRRGWCIGCGRTGAEIAQWRAADDEWRRAIIGTLPQRMAALTG